MTGWLYDDDWRNAAVCRREVADAYTGDRKFVANKWWPVKTQQGKTVLTVEVEEALRRCNGAKRPDGTVAVPECPVRFRCLEAGMAERDGIWGGLLPEQREALRRRQQRQERKILADRTWERLDDLIECRIPASQWAKRLGTNTNALVKRLDRHGRRDLARRVEKAAREGAKA